MGFRIESYSLSELHRIAVPGEVPPSLFWALPVGDWRPGELDQVWQWFTERPGECNNFGLLLVKDMGRHTAEQDNVNLASVGAKLSDLMPAGAERFARSSAYQGEAPRVLVLSGGYPQPGWGVLVEWSRLDVQEFEDLIGETTARLRKKSATNKLDVFMEARQSFRRLQSLRDPPRLNVSPLESEILAAEKVENFIRDAQIALRAGEYPAIGRQAGRKTGTKKSDF